jgi:hypothetical protein
MVSGLEVVVWWPQESVLTTVLVPGTAEAEAVNVMEFDTQTTDGLALAFPPEK